MAVYTDEEPILVTSVASSVRFPIECPRCTAKAGSPVGVSDPTRCVVTVQIGCSKCGNSWTMQA